MRTEYVIRHRTLGDAGGFSSQTEATLVAIALGFPLADWSIELVEALELADVAPFADLPQTPARDRALERWARA